jgi:hypothetical protein
MWFNKKNYKIKRLRKYLAILACDICSDLLPNIHCAKLIVKRSALENQRLTINGLARLPVDQE